jgi:hypothetical protein
MPRGEVDSAAAAGRQAGRRGLDPKLPALRSFAMAILGAEWLIRTARASVTQPLQEKAANSGSLFLQAHPQLASTMINDEGLGLAAKTHPQR